MKIAWLSGLSDQNLVTNPQCYKDRQNRSSLLSISMITTYIANSQIFPFFSMKYLHSFRRNLNFARSDLGLPGLIFSPWIFFSCSHYSFKIRKTYAWASNGPPGLKGMTWPWRLFDCKDFVGVVVNIPSSSPEKNVFYQQEKKIEKQYRKFANLNVYIVRKNVFFL